MRCMSFDSIAVFRCCAAGVAMSLSYTCPNPECGVTLKTPTRVPAGKSVKCPKCTKPFVPEPVEKDSPNLGTIPLAEEPAKKPKKSAPPKSEPAPTAPAATKKPFDDDDEDAESVKKGYGVVSETEAEK